MFIWVSCLWYCVQHDAVSLSNKSMPGQNTTNYATDTLHQFVVICSLNINNDLTELPFSNEI